MEDDIALSLSALGIRIIAPIPGKGTIGIEVPHTKPTTVSMKSLILSPKFQNAEMELPVALGKTISNETFVTDAEEFKDFLTRYKSNTYIMQLISAYAFKYPDKVSLVV